MGDSLVPGDELAALNIVQEIIQEDFKEAFWNRNRYHRILYVGVAHDHSIDDHISEVRKRLDEIEWQVVTAKIDSEPVRAKNSIRLESLQSLASLF